MAPFLFCLLFMFVFSFNWEEVVCDAAVEASKTPLDLRVAEEPARREVVPWAGHIASSGACAWFLTLKL